MAKNVFVCIFEDFLESGNDNVVSFKEFPTDETIRSFLMKEYAFTSEEVDAQDYTVYTSSVI